MITTCLPSALINTSSGMVSPSHRLFCKGRYSMARCTPFSSRPGTHKSRDAQAPPESNRASLCCFNSFASISLPTWLLVLKVTPSASSCSSRLSSLFFSILNSGIPYLSKPPIRSALSCTVTSWPARASCCAAASPAGPEPIMATFLPVFFSCIWGFIQPLSHALSIIDNSTAFIVTGSSFIPSTQDPSQGAGHKVPVNSGKLFVACRRSMASIHWSR